MGILSTLLTVGGAALGFVVGGPAGASLGASLGGSVGGAVDQSHASSTAKNDLVQGQQNAQAARDKAFGQVQTYQAPFLAAGPTGVNALTSRLNLGGPSGAPAAAGNPATSNALTSQPGSAPAAPAGRYDEGIGDGTQDTAAPPMQQAAPPVNALTGGGPAPSSGTDPGTFGSTANPTEPGTYQGPGTYAGPGTYSAPAAFKYDLTDYKASPGYQWQQDQGRNSILASKSATGALQSGAALKELQDRAQNIAYQDFTNERAFAAGRYDTSNNNALTAFNVNANNGLTTFNTNATQGLNTYNTNRNAYADDRNYLTGRFDTGTNNLFNYTGIGQNAAGLVSGAATVLGNGAANSALGIGDAQAGNALQQGNIGANLAGDVAGTIAGAIKPKPAATPTGATNWLAYGS